MDAMGRVPRYYEVSQHIPIISTRFTVHKAGPVLGSF